jgi:hypothetical protein
MTFQGRQSQLKLINAVTQQCHLSLEAHFTLGAALDPSRLRGSVQHGLQRHQSLRTVWPVDQSGCNVAVAVPRAQSRAGHPCLSLGRG